MEDENQKNVFYIYRKQANITQEEIAQAIGKSVGTIRVWEEKGQQITNPDSLFKIIEILKREGVLTTYSDASSFWADMGPRFVEPPNLEQFYTSNNGVVMDDDPSFSLQPDLPPLSTSPLEPSHTQSSRPILPLLIGCTLLLVGILSIFAWKNRSSSNSTTDISSVQNVESSSSILSSSKLDQHTSVPEPQSSSCGEHQRAQASPTFRREQGVSLFLPTNTDGVLYSSRVRTLEITQNGLWAGFFEASDGTGGLSHSDKATWARCDLPQQNINDLEVDSTGRLWVAFESRGILAIDENGFSSFTSETDSGLPSNIIFGLTIDEDGHIWAATNDGIARYDGRKWNTIYTVENKTLVVNDTHKIAFDQAGNIWVGYISDGLSVYRQETDQQGTDPWEHLQATPDGLGGNEIRDIYVQRQSDGADMIWIATGDGGVSVYADGGWTTYTEANGLPSNQVLDVDQDSHGRIWVATDGGVSYLQDGQWVEYHTLPSRSLAFGCDGCLYDADHVWTATWGHGLTHSRLPYMRPGATVTDICFEVEQRTRECVPFPAVVWQDGKPTVTVTYPTTLEPGQAFRMEMFLAPTTSRTFSPDRGDTLVSLDATIPDSDPLSTMYGTYIQITPKRDVAPGEPYRFTDDQNPFIAPDVPDGQTEYVFTSRWRMWMHTRHTGPRIQLRFRVADGQTTTATPTP